MCRVLGWGSALPPPALAFAGTLLWQWAGSARGKAALFSIVGKRLGFFLGKGALSPHPALEKFPQLSTWCPVLGTSVPKAPFPFSLKLSTSPFPSLAGPKLVFLLTHPAAGEDVPTDRGWLNSSFPLCCQPCSDQEAIALCSQQQQDLFPPLHTLRWACWVLFSVPPHSSSKAPVWRLW